MARWSDSYSLFSLWALVCSLPTYSTFIESLYHCLREEELPAAFLLLLTQVYYIPCL